MKNISAFENNHSLFVPSGFVPLAVFSIVFYLPRLRPCRYGNVHGGPILSVYHELDSEMLLRALVALILGGIGSFVTGFIYTFDQVFLPDFAYVILFLSMM